MQYVHSMYAKTIFIVTTAIPNLLFFSVHVVLETGDHTDHTPRSGDYQADL